MRVTPSFDTIIPLPIKADIGVEREPDITFDGSNYVVVWSEGDFGGMHRVRAARVTPQGAVLDSGIVFGKDAYLEYRPSICSGGGRCLAVWYAYDEPFGVFGRFLDDQAQPVGDAFDITTSLTNHFYDPDVAYAGGRYLVVWNEQTAYAGDEVFGQVVDTNGTLIGDVIPIGVGPGYQSMQRVTGDETFLAVWDASGKIFGQMISIDGQLIGSNFEISDPASGDRLSPDIAFGSDNCLAVWMQYHNNSYDIFGNLEISTGISETYEPCIRSSNIRSTLITGSLRQFLGRKNPAIYDITGRIVTSEHVSPGVYFMVTEKEDVKKIIKVR